MASLEHRGESIRVLWRLGGTRDGARQSCTFSGGTPEGRLKTANLAKALVESRGHSLTRSECYDAIIGTPDPTPAAATPTVRQWAYQWLTMLREGGQVDGETVRNYERRLRLRAFPHLGHLRVTDVSRDHVTAWVKWMTAGHITIGSRNHRTTETRRLSAQTIRDNYWTLSACLGAAVPTWIPTNPAARLPGEGKNALGLPKAARFDAIFLTPTEISLILGQCDDPLRDLVTVALRSGLRRGELVALDARHVVFPRAGGATILVRHTAKANGTIGAPKSAAGCRDVPLSGKAAEILGARVRKLKPSQLVFPDPKGGMWEPTSLYKSHWLRAVAAAQRCPDHLPDGVTQRRAAISLNDVVSSCDCAGVLRRRPRFHDLRHTHASVLIDKGWHAKKIQLRLGHSTYQTTMEVYGHLMDLGNEGELNGLDDWFDD